MAKPRRTRSRHVTVVAAAPDAALDWPAFIREYTAWAVKAFPNGTALSASKHLMSEAGELAADQTPEEAADCLMLLLFISDKLGIDLLAEARRKFEINQTRRWGLPNAQGYVEHVRAAAPDASQPGAGE